VPERTFFWSSIFWWALPTLRINRLNQKK
jgi:hypothetical protein